MKTDYVTMIPFRRKRRWWQFWRRRWSDSKWTPFLTEAGRRELLRRRGIQ